MGLKKLLKKAKKLVKKSINLNPLIPGSKAQKTLSAAAKKGIPAVASLGGAPAIGAAQQAILGGLPQGLSQPGGLFDDIGDALKKAREIAAAFGGSQPDAGVPVAQPAPVSQGMNPWLIVGAVAVVGVVLIARKR